MSERSWRLLIHPPADAARNMAVDETLLEAHVSPRSHAPTTLRLYGWSPAALSLGRGQAAASACDPRYLRARGIGLVRRPTGGRAVLHEHERTFAIAGSLERPPFDGGVVPTYGRVAQALALALGRLGAKVERSSASPPARSPAGAACFEIASIHEITAGGRKLVGSAQVRRRSGFLQHGSIPLRLDAERLAGALGGSVRDRRFTDLERASGRRPSPDELDDALVRAVEQVFGVRCVPGTLDAAEWARVERLRCWKYDSAAWTLDGRTGERERRWGGI